MAKIVTLKSDKSDDFPVEKNVPRQKVGRSLKYPFGAMDVGDSFPIGTDQTIAHKVRCAACHYAKRHKRKYSILRMDHDGNYRCWRIK